MIVVAILAILAVVAVPAFIKYMAREDPRGLRSTDKIHKGAATYYTQGKVANKTVPNSLCVSEYSSAYSGR